MSLLLGLTMFHILRRCYYCFRNTFVLFPKLFYHLRRLLLTTMIYFEHLTIMLSFYRFFHCRADGAHPRVPVLYRDICDRRQGVEWLLRQSFRQVLHHRRDRVGRRCTRGATPRRHPVSGLLCQGTALSLAYSPSSALYEEFI